MDIDMDNTAIEDTSKKDVQKEKSEGTATPVETHAFHIID